MFEFDSKIDDLIKNNKHDEAEVILYTALDELTDEAGVMCNNGDYPGALEKYQHILNLMQRYYGNSVDLKRIEDNIAEIQELI